MERLSAALETKEGAGKEEGEILLTGDSSRLKVTVFLGGGAFLASLSMNTLSSQETIGSIAETCFEKKG